MNNMDMLSLLAGMMRQRTNEDVYDRDYAIKRHMDARKEFSVNDKEFKYTTAITQTTSLAPNNNMAQVELSRANMLTIEDLVKAGPETVHGGKFLLCRSIAPCFKINALNIAVDDPAGKQALPLSLYNYKPKSVSRSKGLSDMVPVGCKIALMNPWFKRSMAGFPALRCENPGHFVILEENHPILSGIQWTIPVAAEAGEVQQIGNPYENMEPTKAGLCFLADKTFDKAVESFTKAIENDPNNAQLYANRAVAYENLGKPALSLLDAERGLDIDATNLKLLLRKGKALFALKRYEDCLEFLKRDVKRGGISEIAAFYNEVNQAYREWKHGKYDMIKLIDEADQNYSLNHAEFFDSSLIEVRSVPGCERGAVAKEDIPAGTLLMVCKAFAYKKADEKAIQVDINFENSSVDFGKQELVAIISEKLLHDPSLGHEFYQLYAGDELRWLDELDERNVVDIERIQNIVKCNAFEAGGDKNLGELSKYIHDTGVWIKSSYINHSCSDINCVHIIIGDLMFVRSIKKINKDEQLLWQYMHPTTLFEERDRALRETYGFVCNCRMCLLESAESPETRSAICRVTREFEALKKKTKVSSSKKTKAKSTGRPDDSEYIAHLKRLLDEARALRRNQPLDLLAARIATSLAHAHLCQSQFSEAATLLEPCFELFEEFGLYLPALDVAHGLSLCYHQMSNQRVASSWENKSRSLAKTMLGDEKLLSYIKKKIL